jgi:hypothetical protein
VIVWLNDFQHWPPWRPLVVAAATELVRFTRQHLIAPQTILARTYLEQIFAGLHDAGLGVFHVVLDADEDILRERIQGSAAPCRWPRPACVAKLAGRLLDGLSPLGRGSLWNRTTDYLTYIAPLGVARWAP